MQKILLMSLLLRAAYGSEYSYIAGNNGSPYVCSKRGSHVHLQKKTHPPIVKDTSSNKSVSVTPHKDAETAEIDSRKKRSQHVAAEESRNGVSRRWGWITDEDYSYKNDYYGFMKFNQF
eukprot:CAMPEP_0196815728 /NCGR_PEP_ID=MMETSP1362-20130617/51472_1 /TAXON_ID=163516 /ORGANISM="Leptocylindrus danicus, Strain CCMP1856" /LENGTH=118 /DNA_ID=CAMNT_0042192791 /DNA_START=64 /DNA_END=420 /DNA_ORIENTATION=+